MKKRFISFMLVVLITFPLFSQENLLQKELLVNNKYLLLPVDSDESKSRISFIADDFDTYFDIRLASHKDSIDYWVFMNVEQFMKEKILLSADFNNRLNKGFNLVFFDDEIRTETPVYSEELRQQLHYSPKRGWISDPNGLVCYDGEYHLYYQHDPYNWEKSLAHWGHAVSTDLIHAEAQSIEALNWPEYSYKPEVKFRIAYMQDQILLKYYVNEENIMAKETKVNGDVYKDSCVEFFISPDRNDFYYNFEFNCIGTHTLAMVR